MSRNPRRPGLEWQDSEVPTDTRESHLRRAAEHAATPEERDAILALIDKQIPEPHTIEALPAGIEPQSDGSFFCSFCAQGLAGKAQVARHTDGRGHQEAAEAFATS